MNTFIIVLTNGTQISIKADDFKKNTEQIRFMDLTKDQNIAIFINDNIAGFYLKQYEA